MSIIKIFDQTIPYVSGYSMRSKYVADNIARHGFSVKVFSSPIFSYDLQTETRDGVNYFRCLPGFPNAMKKMPFLKEFLTVKKIKQSIDKNWNSNIGLIHAHSSALNGFAGMVAAKKHGVPFIYEVRALWEDAAVDQNKTHEGSLRYKFIRNFETNILKKADRITVICEGLKDDIVSRGIDENKITIVPNGVDSNIFKPLTKDKELVKKYSLEGFAVIGFVGTFFLFEGLDILIKAAPLILGKNQNVKFLIVGGGLEERRLKDMVIKLGLTKNIIFTGRVKHGDINRYYSVADILVYPRLSKRITELVTPLKPLEAMALEKPVIASNVGGLKELVKDGVNGMLFKAGDANDLSEKCLFLLNNRGYVEKIAGQARNYVIKERGWASICERYVRIYKELGVSQ